MFWGITPALDLLEEYERCERDLPSEVNVLIVGGADGRHVLKTIARRYKHKLVKLNFYLIEPCMETVAKQLLLLLTALQPQSALGLEQKTRIFMELYGNTLLRPYTSKYLTAASEDMVEMITNYDYLQEKINFLHMDLKYKERDYLENIVKFWCGRGEFNIMEIWDKRLRKSLGIRYDSKEGAFDWDLHMRMHPIGGKQVCNQEYKSFRRTGVAFTWLESEVSRPNRSLVCAVIPNGTSFAHYGYLGDMEIGPFVTFGLQCEDPEFLKSTNGKNAYRATDVTERNLKQVFYEMEHQEEYQHTKKNEMELGYAVIRQEKILVDIKPSAKSSRRLESCFSVKNVAITFLSIASLSQMDYSDKYENMFDIIYFASNCLKYYSSKVINKVAKSEAALLLVEHQLFVVNHRKSGLEEYAKSVREIVKDTDMEELEFELEKSCYFRFRRTCVK
ncbi:dynein axonemal assembly factor 3 homolog [Anthonomus grandis grandis]|uniref:dynein axonemal assembly factor 3 homolog n=1 Tax=Anthonomus grandis grandis TaxID=2921223 RepID=UPI002165BF06|nr:dynein axonemal assembly factor 3 homolog [Anthonomus grandis grandis]